MHYFWTNLLAYGSNYTVPWSNIFLSVDRCLILLLPFTRKVILRRNFVLFSVFIISLSFLGVVLALLIPQMTRDVSGKTFLKINTLMVKGFPNFVPRLAYLANCILWKDCLGLFLKPIFP